MYRVHKSGRKYLAIQVDIETDEERENIEDYLSQGEPVILVNEIDDLQFLDIDPDKVEIVEPE